MHHILRVCGAGTRLAENALQRHASVAGKTTLTTAARRFPSSSPAVFMRHNSSSARDGDDPMDFGALGESRPERSMSSRLKSFGDAASTSPPSAVLFVGNLSFNADEEMLGEAFEAFGTVQSVRMPTDRDSGRTKGFGFVEFSSVEEAENAFEKMNGEQIDGREIRLDYSQPRPPREEGGFRGGRGGFGGGRGGGRGGFGGRGGGRGGGFGMRSGGRDGGDFGGRGGDRGGDFGGRGGDRDGGFGGGRGGDRDFGGRGGDRGGDYGGGRGGGGFGGGRGGFGGGRGRGGSSGGSRGRSFGEDY